MTGITYAIAEILLLLAVAAGIGFFIGRLTVRTTPVASSDGPRVKDLEAQVASLNAASATAVEPGPTDAAMRKDLEVAVWEIEALQEEVVRLRKANPDSAPAIETDAEDGENEEVADSAEDDVAPEGDADHEDAASEEE